MEYGEEQAIWKAIGETDGAVNEFHDEMNALRFEIDRIRTHSSGLGARMFSLGLIAGVLGIVAIAHVDRAINGPSIEQKQRAACWYEARGWNRSWE